MKTIAIFDDLEKTREDYDKLMMKSSKTNKIVIIFPLLIIYLIGPIGIFIYWLIRIFYAKSN